MLRNLIAILLLATPLLAADPPVERKMLKPGLVGKSLVDLAHENVPDKWYFAQRLDPTIGLMLNRGEAMNFPNIRGNMTYWNGYIQIVTAGEYTFSANIQGCKVSVHLSREDTPLKLLVAEGEEDKLRLVQGEKIKLEAGFYVFRALVTE